MIGSTALFWINALACVMGARDKVLPWDGFAQAIACLFASPFVAGILVIMGLVKGTVAVVGNWRWFGSAGVGNGETRVGGPAGEEEELADMEGGRLSRAETEVPLESLAKGRD